MEGEYFCKFICSQWNAYIGKEGREKDICDTMNQPSGVEWSALRDMVTSGQWGRCQDNGQNDSLSTNSVFSPTEYNLPYVHKEAILI
jgi:hypothetical protein